MAKEIKEKPKRIFKLTLCERFLHAGDREVVCKQIDNVGLNIYSSGDKKELEPDFVRGHLIGTKGASCFVEAYDPEEAIRNFHEQWECAKIGGNGRKKKALWIVETVLVQGLPGCELLHRSKDGRYICGEEVGDNGNGVFGMCVLDFADCPGGHCPICSFWDRKFELEQADKLPVRQIEVDGEKYLFVMAEDVLGPEALIESPALKEAI